MLNFTVGPVMMYEDTLNLGTKQIPYFRTPEFSQIMFENENYIKSLLSAGNSSKVITITGSGTASMEASVGNFFSKSDKIFVLNGGSFGHRFVELCSVYRLAYTEIMLEPGKTITADVL